MNLTNYDYLFVRQRYEIGELFGFESRNKYEIVNKEQQPIAFAAEQQKGFFGFLFRQFLGHWRTFDIHLFNPERQLLLIARHPFRIFFQRLELTDSSGTFLGAIQQRFSILSKRFDVIDRHGRVILQVSSPIWKMWTFPFIRGSRKVATVEKKWSGLLTEAFTDKDNFAVKYDDPNLSNEERQLVLAAALFIDLQYFERKAND